MPKQSVLANTILLEYKRIKRKYCVDCQYMKDDRCTLKRNVKQCFKSNNKNVGGNNYES